MFIVFFKQKTAYEMRISDCSSDVCSSDLKRVLISAPAKGVDLTVCYGVNHEKLTAEHTIVSNASCTTNCLAPVATVMNDTTGIERGLMPTIHAYTNDQQILHPIHHAMRRPRTAGLSLIPTSPRSARRVRADPQHQH